MTGWGQVKRMSDMVQQFQYRPSMSLLEKIVAQGPIVPHKYVPYNEEVPEQHRAAVGKQLSDFIVQKKIIGDYNAVWETINLNKARSAFVREHYKEVLRLFDDAAWRQKFVQQLRVPFEKGGLMTKTGAIYVLPDESDTKLKVYVERFLHRDASVKDLFIEQLCNATTHQAKDLSREQVKASWSSLLEAHWQKLRHADPQIRSSTEKFWRGFIQSHIDEAYQIPIFKHNEDKYVSAWHSHPSGRLASPTDIKASWYIPMIVLSLQEGILGADIYLFGEQFRNKEYVVKPE